MARMPNFVGPSNPAFSRAVDAERTVNYIPCLKDAGTPKVQGWLEGGPGYAPFCALPSGPVRALFAQDFGSGDRCFAVAGDVFCEILRTGTSVSLGTVAVDGNPATIHTNGSAGYQLLITSGGLPYCYDLLAGTFAPVTGDGVPSEVVMGGFCEGYGLLLQASDNWWAFSQPEDFTDWPGLNFVRISESSNNVRAIAVNHNEVWNLGQFTTEVWVLDSSSSVFGPVPGVFIEEGIWAPWSVSVLDNALFWCGGGKRGHGVVYRNDGYNVRVVSNQAVSAMLQALPRFDDAIGWSYQAHGHAFYVLYVPAAETTWVYDVTTELWHERGQWDDRLMRYTPDVGRCHTFAFGEHLVGDRSTPTVYRMSVDLYSYRVVA